MSGLFYAPQFLLLYARSVPLQFDVAGAAQQVVSRVPIPAGMLLPGFELVFEGCLNRQAANVATSTQGMYVRIGAPGFAFSAGTDIAKFELTPAPADLWMAGTRVSALQDAVTLRVLGNSAVNAFSATTNPQGTTAAGIGLTSFVNQACEIGIFLQHSGAAVDYKTFTFRGGSLRLRRNAFTST